MVSLAFPPDQSIPAARTYVEHLIATNQLSATLYHSNIKKDMFLRFTPPRSTDLSKSELERRRLHDILRQKQRMEMLSVHMTETRRKLELSKEFIDLERKVRKNAVAAKEDEENGVGGTTLLPTQEFEAMDEDEALLEL